MATISDTAAALAAVPESELRSLRVVTNDSPHLVPGLLAWLEAAVDWELHRRRGFLYHLLGPIAAIDDTEYHASLAALAVLAGRCRQGGHRDTDRVADSLELAAALLRDEAEVRDL